VVIATGGGLVSELPTFERLLNNCYTIWLQASPNDYWERVLRQGDYRVSADVGTKQAMADMRRILSQREALYSKADARLQTSSKTTARCLRDLLALARKAHPRPSAARVASLRRPVSDAKSGLT
jgi:XRE family transcriptional regulator, aerobic/anaerobic benzoate catabolism transcriptional regulator